ncbi:MAG: hypothetical protein KAU95_02220 [Candidatus Aenigmarchaeota archaeon]|nr:hypothetical protein [Candidatus Aenigmarchaeota archaeon]
MKGITQGFIFFVVVLVIVMTIVGHYLDVIGVLKEMLKAAAGPSLGVFS